MKKKTLLTIAFISVLLLSAVAGTQLANLASANFLQPGVPEHTFEIKESGNVIEKVGTDRIQRNGTLYTFTEDIFGSIVIFHNNMVIDGAGYSLQGNGTGTGIFLQGINNVIVKNLRITNFTVGIEVTWSSVAFGIDSSNIVVQGNTITNTEYGIHAESPINLRVLENTISNNKMGIFSYDSSGLESHCIFVYGNNISNNSVGIETHQIKSTVCHNNFLNNTSQANATKPYWYHWYTTMWHDDSLKKGNFWSDYNGTDANGDGIGDTPYVIYENHTDRYPLVDPWGTPAIFVIHPGNVAYAESVPLNFTVSKSASWMDYSLDGQDNVTITGNTTLTGLAGGLHNITFYATDIYGSIGASETIHFSIETFPTTIVIASAVPVAIACIGLLIYFKKRNH